MCSDLMTGVANADFATADTTTKRNASICVDTATSVVVIRAPSAVEEDLKEKTGTTTLDTGTKIKNSEDRKVRTKLTKEQVREREHQAKH